MVIYRIIYFGVVFGLVFQTFKNSCMYVFSKSNRSLIKFMADLFSMIFLSCEPLRALRNLIRMEKILHNSLGLLFLGKDCEYRFRPRDNRSGGTDYLTASAQEHAHITGCIIVIFLRSDNHTSWLDIESRVMG